MKLVKFSIPLISLCSFWALSAASQQLGPIPVDTALRARTFAESSPVRFSPDGKMLAFTVKDPRKGSNWSVETYFRTGLPSYASGGDVWIADTQSGETRSLTERKGNNWNPTWSPDGRYLAFLSDRDEDSQLKLWVWEVGKGSLRKISDVPVRSYEIEWLPDNRTVLVGVLPEQFTPKEYVERILRPAAKKTAEAMATDETIMLYSSVSVPRRGDATIQSPPWNLDQHLKDLALMDTGNGTVRRIDRGHRIVRYLLSPSGSSAVISSPKRFKQDGSQQIFYDLMMINLAVGTMRSLATDVSIAYLGMAISWAPDSSRLGYRADDGDCYVVDVRGATRPRNVSRLPHPESGRGVFPPVWDFAGTHIYFTSGQTLWQASVEADQRGAIELSRIAGREMLQLIAHESNLLWSPDGGRSVVVLTRDDETRESGFYKIDLNNGKTTKLLEDKGCYTCVRLFQLVSVRGQAGPVAYFRADAQHDTDLWIADAGFLNSRRLTRLNPEFEKYQMGAVRQIEWRSLDGERLHGFLLLPAGYQEGKKYPLITKVYGGALSHQLNSSFGLQQQGMVDNLQLLASRGYAVLLPDAPQHLGTPMVDLAKTVLPGIDKVIEMGVADPDRLGVMGHSYGGYSVLSLIVQTTRFKAALMSAGSGDLIASYGHMREDGSAYTTPIAERGQILMGGTPWQFRERYIENSPVFYLDRVDTPVLIVHGDADAAVAPWLGDEVFVGLRRLGKEAVYAKYKGEDHLLSGWSLAHQLDYWSRLISWFDIRLNTVKK